MIKLATIICVIVLALIGCKSKIDKSLEVISPYEKFFIGKSIELDSLPMGFEKQLADFSNEFKK